MRAAVYAGLTMLGLSVGCQGESSAPLEEDENVIFLDIETRLCPEIGGIDVFPLEAWVGSEITLRAVVDEGTAQFSWRARSGSFSDPFAAETRYTCAEPGDHVIVVAIDQGTLCEEASDLAVTCSRNPACGNATLDDGEQCDDGNTLADDNCSDLCRFEIR